jgi:hypothetical protein
MGTPPPSFARSKAETSRLRGFTRSSPWNQRAPLIAQNEMMSRSDGQRVDRASAKCVCRVRWHRSSLRVLGAAVQNYPRGDSTNQPVAKDVITSTCTHHPVDTHRGTSRYQHATSVSLLSSSHKTSAACAWNRKEKPTAHIASADASVQPPEQGRIRGDERLLRRARRTALAISPTADTLERQGRQSTREKTSNSFR